MSCIECEDWPDLADVPGCCTPPEDLDPTTAELLWDAAVYLVQGLAGPCWQVCTHSVEICRPCLCASSCNPCGCCGPRQRVQVPWLCGEIVGVDADGVELDPADWNLVNGWAWPTSCSWPCRVTLTVEVGSAPPGGLLVATKHMFCRLAADCVPGACELPEGTVSITSPDGVTVNTLTLDAWLAKNMTGIALIDRLVTAYPCPGAEGARMIDPADWSRTTHRGGGLVGGSGSGA